MSYRRELEKYRDLDEDEILGALTEEELRTLENELDELDPDVSRRQRGHLVHVRGRWRRPPGGGQADRMQHRFCFPSTAAALESSRLCEGVCARVCVLC